ncbi:MAG: HD domain-containing protein [Candidatus Glassbacteria bacterium]|nr:HD domain-containing protein [Candidatus Glassbacteria bacterium]
MHVDHIVPDMELESDVRLQAGSFLITRKELPNGRLDEKVIDSIRRFAGQLAPVKHRVSIKPDEGTYTHLRQVLEKDISRMTEVIEAGTDYPNFLQDTDLRGKVLRVVEKLISNPDIIRSMYEFKIGADSQDRAPEQILDHSIRTTMLVIAVGLKLRWSIISLVNVGMAAILHDMGIVRTETYPGLQKLDDLLPNELEAFIKEHQEHSANVFGEQKLTMLPFTKNEIQHIISNHHRPDLKDIRHKTTLLLYFAELIDEMLSPLPHKVRYNFTQSQIKVIGEKFTRRTGLVNVLLGLIKLFRDNGMCWSIVSSLVEVFSMQELMVEGYEEKLKEVIDFCPFKCAVAYPHAGGNSLPRTAYCNNSNDPSFSCQHMGQVRIEIYLGAGKVKSYNKCATLTNKLHSLNKSGREDQSLKTGDKDEDAKAKNKDLESKKKEPPKEIKQQKEKT